MFYSLFDRGDYIVDGQVRRVDDHVRLSIELLPAVQELRDFRLGVRSPEEWAVGLLPDALIDRFGPGRETDHETSLFHGVPVHIPDHGAAPGRDHLFLALHDLSDDPR